MFRCFWSVSVVSDEVGFDVHQIDVGLVEFDLKRITL